MFQSPDERGIECYFEIDTQAGLQVWERVFQSPDERGIECYHQPTTNMKLLKFLFQSPDERGIECYISMKRYVPMEKEVINVSIP